MIHAIVAKLNECSFSNEEVGEGLHSLAAGHSRLAEEGSHPAAGVELRIHLAAEEGNPAVDRNRLAAGRSSEERLEVGGIVLDHRNRLAVEEERRIQEVHPEGGSTFRPWYRTRDQLHQGSA